MKYEYKTIRKKDTRPFIITRYSWHGNAHFATKGRICFVSAYIPENDIPISTWFELCYEFENGFNERLKP